MARRRAQLLHLVPRRHALSSAFFTLSATFSDRLSGAAPTGLTTLILPDLKLAAVALPALFHGLFRHVVNFVVCAAFGESENAAYSSLRKTTNAQYKSMSPVTNSRILTLQVIEQKSELPDNPMPLKTEKNEASSVDWKFKRVRKNTVANQSSLSGFVMIVLLLDAGNGKAKRKKITIDNTGEMTGPLRQLAEGPLRQSAEGPDQLPGY
nr:hypothetical protein Iba_chr01aCG5720 [Ipomoea batatas]